MRMRFGHLLLWLSMLVLLVGGGGLFARTWLIRSRLVPPEEVLGLMKAGEFARAQAGLASYLAVHPDDGKARLLMAQIAVDRPDPQPDTALEQLRLLRPGEPRQAALARFFEGKAYYLQKRYDLAEARWRDALRIDPLVPEAGWALVDLLDLQGRSEEAHRVGMRQHELEPDPLDRVRILLELARIDIDKVAPGSIVQNFEALQRRFPDDLVLGTVVGLALVHDSRGDEGTALLEDVLRRHPDDPDAWAAWLTGLDDAGRHERFAEECARLPRSLSGDWRFARHQGRLAQMNRDWKAAARAYRRALEAEPYDGVLLYKLHHVLRLGGEAAEAERVNRALTAYQTAFKEMRKVYQEAIKVRTLGTAPHPELYHRLAALREQMGRRDEALAWNRLILQDRPDDPLSLAALERLK